jgi:cobalamin biosynthetic protein CobC
MSIVLQNTDDLTSPPVHGGDVRRILQEYPDAPEPLLDLSAALNPLPWAVPDRIPLQLFHHLPDGYDELLLSACSFYQQDNLWPVNGSQQAIEVLPRLRSESVIAVPDSGYQEHAWCWKKQGHSVFRYQAEDLIGDNFYDLLSQIDVLVVINPNNPTGQLFSSERLRLCYQYLAEKGGWLIVDEAFMDILPVQIQKDAALISEVASDGLWVLRSLGKYSGLAGIRSGFVASSVNNLQLFRLQCGPWHMSAVTAWLTQQFLQDKRWHENIKTELHYCFSKQKTLLQHYFSIIGETPLFLTCQSSDVTGIQNQLAQSGIRVRAFPEQGWLRFGLLRDNSGHHRLKNTLKQKAL